MGSARSSIGHRHGYRRPKPSNHFLVDWESSVYRLPALKLRAIAFCLLGSVAYGQAGLVGVNFVGGDDNPPGNDASELLSDEVAGFIAQMNWNNVAPHSNNFARGNGGTPDEIGTFLDLVDSTGAATTIDVSWNAENTFEAGNPLIDNGDERLLDGYLDNSEEQPMVEIQLNEIPFASYDVLVYFGSDGNNRSGSIRLNEDPSTDRFYLTSTGLGNFQGPADYFPTTATAPNDAPLSNYVVYEGIQGSSLTIQNLRGNTNSGIHGFQIAQRLAPSILRVNSLTGQAFIVGGDTIAVDLNGIEISSSAGGLEPTRYRSLGSQGLDETDGPIDADETPGNSIGESWQIVFDSEESLIEGFLFGSTSLDASTVLSLGRLYDTSLGAVDATMSFTYTLTTGQVVEGQVEFFSDIVEGDFNGDGTVNTADYARYRENLGGQDESLIGNAGNGDGVIDESDLTLWRENFGFVAPTTATIPEPSMLTMLTAAAALLFLSTRRLSGCAASARLFPESIAAGRLTRSAYESLNRLAPRLRLP